MPNQPAEAYRCRAYLIKCFVHPLVAAMFTTWKQVKRYDNGYSLEEALYTQFGESFPNPNFIGFSARSNSDDSEL